MALPTCTHADCSSSSTLGAAAMARRVYMRGGAGVGAFKKVFGGRKSRGTRPEKAAKGSGSIARHILKQLEILKILEKVPDGKGYACSPCPMTRGLIRVASDCTHRALSRAISNRHASSFRAVSPELICPLAPSQSTQTSHHTPGSA
eukprot:scaffold47691_cov39-Tisochrysis_lutea.AAC.2